jgi:hypothetical protein
MIRLNLVVLRSSNPALLAGFYPKTGLVFQQEKHGNGPVHFAADLEGCVLEIYPQGAEGPSTSVLRLGLTVPHLSDLIGTPGEAVRSQQSTEHGLQAVIVAPEGRVLELTQGS